MKTPDKNSISRYFQSLQDSISTELQQLDGKSLFKEEIWERKEGGGGRSRTILDGLIFEKGGVNFSEVSGPLPDKLKQSFQVDQDDFYATGISLVLHPQNPHVPIVHMNLRYFEVGEQHRWFGGGIDLTPHYVVDQDARAFHAKLKEVCNRHHPRFYPDFKKWADNYFYIGHRNETRGIGGIFFDQLKDSPETSLDAIYLFVKDIGDAFTKTYIPLVKKNNFLPFTPEEKDWQLHRRSRYVEFNLVYDAGTRFGLETNGRIESILMSLPPLASWRPDRLPIAGSREEYTVSMLKKGLDWG